MIKLRIVCVGEIKEKYLCDAIDEYKKRLQKFASVEIIEINQCKIDDEKLSKKQEGNCILDKIQGYSILLDVSAQQMSSNDFAKKIEKIAVEGNSNITFIIGGSFGVSDEIRQKVNYRLSFSQMTFPHQLFRVMLLEQIYRAFSINANMPYHK